MDASVFDKGNIERALGWAKTNAPAPPEPRPVDPAILLTRLLVMYWRDGVALRDAAKLAGLRAKTFAELADLRLGEAALKRLAAAYFGDAFHAAFPWCDAEAVRHGARARTPPCSNPRLGRAPSKREKELVTPPQRSTMREVVPTQRKADAEIARYLRKNPIPLWKRFPDPVESGIENEVPEVKLS